jgi:DNA-binding NtrC family response regulator
LIPVPSFRTRDPAFRRLLRQAERAASSHAAVLITGETGTGKNRLARFLHDHSSRSAGPFVEVACANLPPELLESELFGHEAGAFTDARDSRPGRFEQADGGTVFLDELQEIVPEVQAKVLRAVEEKRFERLGSGETREVDIRIVGSTRSDPEQLVRDGVLRQDLYYRLNVIRLHLPALRERAGDVAGLTAEFLDEARERHGLGNLRFEADALERLATYPWPGNVRELRHVVESAAVMAEGGAIRAADLPGELGLDRPAMLASAASRGLSLAELEDAYIREVLQRTQGNKSAAARILGIHRKTLHEKLRAAGARGES